MKVNGNYMEGLSHIWNGKWKPCLKPPTSEAVDTWSIVISVSALGSISSWTISRRPLQAARCKAVKPSVLGWCFFAPASTKTRAISRCGYGSIPIDTFLVGWTSIYQLFWGSLRTRVLTHTHVPVQMIQLRGAMVLPHRLFLAAPWPQPPAESRPHQHGTVQPPTVKAVDPSSQAGSCWLQPLPVWQCWDWSAPLSALGGSFIAPASSRKRAISTGWWFQPLWKIVVSWDDYSQYIGK